MWTLPVFVGVWTAPGAAARLRWTRRQTTGETCHLDPEESRPSHLPGPPRPFPRRSPRTWRQPSLPHGFRCRMRHDVDLTSRPEPQHEVDRAHNACNNKQLVMPLSWKMIAVRRSRQGSVRLCGQGEHCGYATSGLRMRRPIDLVVLKAMGG